MRSLEVIIESLMMPWIDKAEEDLELARDTVSGPKSFRFRASIGFHCQQAAEKYLKALLTHWQVEFPKTHDLEQLLKLAATAAPRLAISDTDAEWLTRFGVEPRYPSDIPEMLPGDEHRALDIASRVKDAVLAIVRP
jgi:HEPN domain-containing protein